MDEAPWEAFWGAAVWRDRLHICRCASGTQEWDSRGWSGWALLKNAASPPVSAPITAIHLAGAQLHQDNFLIFQSEGRGRQWPLSVVLCVPLDPSYKLFKTIGNFVCSIPPYFTRKKTHSPVTLSFLPGTFRYLWDICGPKVQAPCCLIERLFLWFVMSEKV